MAFENLPQTRSVLHDGNLVISAVNENPVVLVIGTAQQGDSEVLHVVDRVSSSATTYGRTDGTLVRGLYEARAGGAENIRLMRVGASPASLADIGSGTTITVTTNEKDDNAGLNYTITWNDATGRLQLWRVSDDTLVYDNNPVYPSAAIDLNEVSVTGSSPTLGGADIGVPDPVTLAAADGVGGATYTAGDDGITLSRMELFEALFVAYKLLENEDLDVILPQNVYLDDLNVSDMTTAEVTTLNTSAPWAASSVYPEPASSFDALGEVFAQEYEGEWYFWWDMDRDNVAEVFPSVGSATASTDAFGTALTSADFHEANFAYQLANFCYSQSEDHAEMFGVVGVLPPDSWSLKDVSTWLGRVPTVADDSAGNSVITANGTGLMGNKWMAGRLSAAGTGLPGHVIDGIDGLASGGFIGTDDGWPDGDPQKDRNDHLIDIGKYINVVAAQAVLANPSNATSYAATGSAAYGGFVSTLPGNSAPTNKVMPGVRLPFRIATSKLDVLAGQGYVLFHNKPKGIVVSDAPTATRPDSDYRRLSTFRIVKAVIDALRAVADPFLGEGITPTRLAALETAIDNALMKLQKLSFIQRYDAAVTSTPTEQVQGRANVDLLLVPAFELRQITLNVALSAQ
jgi:hypothetical protein